MAVTPVTTTVDPAKIAVALGRTAPEPDSITDLQWKMWIDDAVMLINDRITEVGFTGTIDQVKLDYVVREVVVNHIRHPENSTQVTVSVDDGSSSRSYQSGKGRVTIDDELWERLGLGDPGVEAFTVDTVPMSSTHLPWCSLMMGANYCSCGVDIAGVPIFEGGF